MAATGANAAYYAAIKAEMQARGLTPAAGPTGSQQMADRANAQSGNIEDDALKAMWPKVDEAKTLALGAQDFMNKAKGVPTGPQWGSAPVFGGNPTAINRRQLASRDPALESRLEDLESINSQYWPIIRPPGSGGIRGFDVGISQGAQASPTPAAGWKTSFPSIVNMNQADQDITQRLWDTYADKSNEAVYASKAVRSGRASVPEATAQYQNLKRTPAAAGRHAALGAQPGDFSGKLPDWWQSLPPKQLAAAKMFTNLNYPPGDKNNPYIPSSDAEARWVSKKPGSWYVNENGVRTQVKAKPAAPAGFDWSSLNPF